MEYVKTWLEEMLPADSAKSSMAAPRRPARLLDSQSAGLQGAGCPDVELVITLLRAKPQPS